MNDFDLYSERRAVKQRLEDELADVRFKGEEHVIRQTHPTSLRSRLSAFLNKELEIPVKPAGVLCATLLASAFLLWLPFDELAIRHPSEIQQNNKPRELIHIGGNIYDKSLYERMVNKYEN
ncbi:hypothetical protein D3C78_1060560 [compost metagenome]